MLPRTARRTGGVAPVVYQAKRVWDRWYPRLVVATSASAVAYAIAAIAQRPGR